METITYKDTVIRGQPITCVSPTGLRARLTTGKVYIALHGLEEGIFSSRPFVTVIDDDGEPATAHASRFSTDSQ